MLEDKIQHNIIKINQLTNEKESIRYIIPLYFNAVLPSSYRSNISTKIVPTAALNQLSLSRSWSSSNNSKKKNTRKSCSL